MHYFNYELYEPESSNYESYCLTWFDSKYSKAGPYGEPLQYDQEELLDGFNFSVHKEAEDGFLSGSWYSNDQGYDQIQLPYEGSSSDWLDEYEFYFAGCWGGDMVRQGYNNTFYERYNGSGEKADSAYIGGDPEGSYYNFNEDVKQTYWGNQYPGFDFDVADGINENYHDHGWKIPQPVFDDGWSEMRLWESIFGHWPCLLDLENESQAALSH